MRDDLSNNLVHLTKGTSENKSKHREDAALILRKILKEKKLIGGNGFIKGKHKCVCFSEAPISKLSNVIAESCLNGFKYQPYGIIVDKHWLYSFGGLPVIYGPKIQYDHLPDDMKYRHVTFDLSDQPNIDHTSEREWRIKVDDLHIDPEKVIVVVPDRIAKDVFSEEFKDDNWHFMVLSDLGVKINCL